MSNTTIKGWLWYQGEQNGANPGSYLNKSGYACLLPALDDSWRRAFREGSSTDPDFPIGIISLHGWCGEEEAECTLNPATRTDNTAKIRWAQTAEWGFLPNPRLPHTFVAMAYDQPDPRNGSHCYWNTTTKECDRTVKYPQTCLTGKEICPPPAGLMGGNIHPRNKLLLGDRIARAAKAIAYGDDKIAFTGPVVTGCVANTDGRVTFSFNETLMRGEALRVKVSRGFEARIASTGNWTFVPIATPLGVQADPSVTINAISAVDAVRYNWLDNVACPAAYCDYTKPLVNQSCSNGGSAHHRHDTDVNFWWCFNPMETIALYTAASALPAPPFTLEVVDGKCIMPTGVH
jgi:sialate O-acetylesterase